MCPQSGIKRAVGLKQPPIASAWFGKIGAPIFRQDHAQSKVPYCLRMIFSENRCTLFRIMR
jgi:hypothetical protein